jgi:ABC-type transport system involved in cytochrome c biogenesis ATPase subunit
LSPATKKQPLIADDKARLALSRLWLSEASLGGWHEPTQELDSSGIAI